MTETTFDRISADVAVGLFLYLAAAGFVVALNRTDYALLCGGVGSVLIVRSLVRIRAAGDE